jgi:uncharacterized SAM-binding protein YcdF (DUF218 family)
MNILLILLGCHISYLLNDRIHTAVKFANNFNETNVNIDWFLSGGIKNPHEDTVTEAEKMAREISKFQMSYINDINGEVSNNWNYIYDVVATNTAENFIMTKNFMDESKHDYAEVYIITSNFHYNRAKKIADKIINKDVKWILGDAELEDSRYWETIHIKNVDSDVNNALNKFRK